MERASIPRKSYAFNFALEGMTYTLRFYANSRREAEAEMRALLEGSSFVLWLDKLLPCEDEDEIGSMH